MFIRHNTGGGVDLSQWKMVWEGEQFSAVKFREEEARCVASL